MPRFHFHIHDGKDILDHEGTELPDFQEARRQAIQYAGTLIAQEFTDLPSGEDWWLEVTDAAGLLLFRMDFVVMESPAIRATRRASKLDEPAT